MKAFFRNTIFSGTKNKWSLITIMALTIVFTWTAFNIGKWKEKDVIQSDIVTYYSYLPAAFIYHDLSFDFVDKAPTENEVNVWFQKTSKGKKVQKVTMGQSLLWTPFFLMGHAYAHFTGQNTGGYSLPYHLFLSLAGIFYVLCGFFLLRSILLRYFSDAVTALVILSLALATNLFYYTTNEAAMPPANSFFLFALFTWLVINWNEKPRKRYAFFMGLTGGLIVLIRPTNGLIFLLPLLLGVNSFKDFAHRMKFLWKEKLSHNLLCILGFVLIIFPQLLYWKYATGHWIFYSYTKEGFFFDHPHIIDGLFSYRKGWLLYTPIMGLALIGLFILRKKLKAFRLSLLTFLIINLYLTFSWWSWWYGGGFGARTLVDTCALLAIPLGRIYERFNLKKAGQTAALILIIMAFSCLNLFQSLQKKRNIIHYDAMTKRAYRATFLQIKETEPLWIMGYYQRPNYRRALKGKEEYGWLPELEIYEQQSITDSTFAKPHGEEKHYFIFPALDNSKEIQPEEVYLKASLLVKKLSSAPDFSLGFEFYRNDTLYHRYALPSSEIHSETKSWSEVKAFHRPADLFDYRPERDNIKITLQVKEKGKLQVKNFRASLLLTKAQY